MTTLTTARNAPPGACDRRRPTAASPAGDRLRAALTTARHDVAMALGPRRTAAEELHRDRNVLLALRRRWVRVCVVWDERLLSVPEVDAYASWQVGQGIEVRVAPHVPVTLALVDHHRSVVRTGPGAGADDRATVSERPETVGMLRYLFHSLWEEAEPWTAVGELPEDEHLRNVLTMLAQGCTDEQIAARLNVSKRTVSRSVARIMRELNARSRFEAGALAARLGWFRGGRRVGSAARP